MQQTAVKLYNAYSYAFFTNENQALGEAVSRPITVYIIIDTVNPRQTEAERCKVPRLVANVRVSPVQSYLQHN